MKAYLRNADFIEEGDEVLTDFHHTCAGVTFVVEKITPYDVCESGFLVLVHVKDNIERKMAGHTGMGLDTNWFKKI